MAGLFHELKRRNVVRVGVAYIIVGWVAVQIAELLFDAFGTPEWVLKTVIVLIAIGFPFALLFAWAFELTPEGLKKTREVDLSTSITHNTGRKLDFVIIATLVVALGYFIWERQTLNRAPSITGEPVAISEPAEPAAAEVMATVRRSIAVLPFVNMSSDKEQEWFADGLTEEILNSLAKTPDLLVAARTSSFGFKGSTDPVPQIAASLGVDHVLEGSVRRGGEKVRITAQLIRANDGFHLWSETYDRSLDDIITIQEDIAIRIADALETALDPEALRAMMDVGTASVPAYNAYLTGRGAMRAAQESGDRYVGLGALEAFEEAARLDPAFARAHSAISWFWSLQLAETQMMSGLTDVTRGEQIARRDESLAQAVRVAKDPVEALVYRADQAWNAQDYRRALRLRMEYVDKRPNDDDEFTGMVELMRIFGLHEQITETVRNRYESQPVMTRELAIIALQALRDPKAVDLMRRIAHEAIDRFADDVAMLYQAHRQLLWAGDIDGAARIVPKILGSDLEETNRYLVELRQACAEKRVADASRLHAAALEKYADSLSTRWLSYEIMGDKESAARLLAEYDESGDLLTIDAFVTYPNFDPSQFPNFMKKVAGQGFEDRETIPVPYRCNR
ncbi:MAG: hypothetical protein OEV41_03495 [Gammaproteobacteria bacterium]|nr:hypothetical protein [Gammaproteobacteria bacterium]